MTLPATLAAAVLTFLATNIDDLFILMIFFSQTDRQFRQRHVIAGQYLGFAALVAISLLGFAGSLIVPQELIGLLGLAPIAIGIRKLRETKHETGHVERIAAAGSSASDAAAFLHPKTYSVAAVTFANGGDNIGIYTPLFASMDLPNLVVVLTIFFLLVLVWCILGIRLARQSQIAGLLARYGHRIVPVVLIGLGVFILLENGTFRWLGL
jgi:cadmium resistance transport/sequestration family protein